MQWRSTRLALQAARRTWRPQEASKSRPELENIDVAKQHVFSLHFKRFGRRFGMVFGRFLGHWTFVHRGYPSKVRKYICNGWIYARPPNS